MIQDLTRIVSAATLIIMTATTAHASRQWQHLATDNNGNHLLYDKKSTKRDGDMVSGWVNKQLLVDDKSMKEQGTPLNEYHGKNWVLAFYEFDCKKNTFRSVTGRQDITGKRVEDVPREEFHAAEPKSLDELMLTSICREVK